MDNTTHRTPPRYQPSRALPVRPYLPGRDPLAARPMRDDAPVASAYPLEQTWADNAEYLWGVDLYNNGFFWEAHEAWEGLWRAAPPESLPRCFLQGLIQCAAASLKAAVDDRSACVHLAERGLERLERVRAEHAAGCMGLELAPFIADFRAFAARSGPSADARGPFIELAPFIPAMRD